MRRLLLGYAATVALVGTVGSLPWTGATGRALINPLLIAGAPLLLAASMLAAARGSRYAVFFLCGWTPLLAVTVLGSAQLYGVAPGWTWAADAALVAGAFEALVLSLGDFELFCGGDLTWNVEHRLACPEKRVPQVDVFLVDHHGLDLSNHPALVAALRPRVALMSCGARKGCEPKTFATLKGAAGLEAIFQLHRNLRTGDAGNTIAAHIANDGDPCQGEPLRLVVAEDAKSFEVSVPSKGEGTSAFTLSVMTSTIGSYLST